MSLQALVEPLLKNKTPHVTDSQLIQQLFVDFDKIKKGILQGGVTSSNEQVLQKLEHLEKVHFALNDTLYNYDKKLLAVLDKHEQDFLEAYKTHMTKVEKELALLKNKAKDQEQRLAQDDRILKLEKQVQWFKDELQRLLKQTENYDHDIERLISKKTVMEEEKTFMQNQVKAAKRQNKLLIVALNKSEAQQTELQEEQQEIESQIKETKKQAVAVPSIEYSPFDYTAIKEQSYLNHLNQSLIGKGVDNKEISFLGSTQFPSEINTSRLVQVAAEKKDKDPIIEIDNQQKENLEVEFNQSLQQEQQLSQTVLAQFINDIMSSGRDKFEIVEGVEKYYNQLQVSHDEEIQVLLEQIEKAKAENIQLQAEEIVLPASDLDDLSNFFLECVYAQRKSLRHQLLTLKNGQGNQNMQNSLLKIYMSTVKTGSQEEIEQFSHYEKQKLVQLLATNQELLNYVFDKMFRNKKQIKEENDNQNAQSSRFLDNSAINDYQNQRGGNSIISKKNSINQKPISPFQSKLIQQQTNQTVQQQYIGVQRSDPTISLFGGGAYQGGPLSNIQIQALGKDRKQRSMVVGEINRHHQQNNTYSGVPADQNEAYFSASPLLVQQNTNDYSNLRGQSGILLSKIKESTFNSNMLSQIDTDLLQQQYLSQEQHEFNTQTPQITGQDIQMFPDINQRQLQVHQMLQDLGSKSINAKRSRSSYDAKKGNLGINKIRGVSTTRPMMQIRNGKLLIMNKQKE